MGRHDAVMHSESEGLPVWSDRTHELLSCFKNTQLDDFKAARILEQIKISTKNKILLFIRKEWWEKQVNPMWP